MSDLQGKCWAALKGDRIIGCISMRVPNDVDFDSYRSKAQDCLSLLGEVRSGHVVERDGQKYFVQRANHANRSKTPKKPKEFIIPGGVLL